MNNTRVLPLKILVLLLTLTSLPNAQLPGPKRKTFHVTEVSKSDDECFACAATQIRVSGFVKEPGHSKIQYDLDCTEVTPLPQNKTATRTACARVEAGEDYVAKLYPTAVSFWGEGQHVEGAVMLLYNIASQREMH